LILLQILALLIVAGFAVILGGMATAWRRACVTIAHNVALAKWAYSRNSAEMPSVRDLSQSDIIRFTPRWVSGRHVLALGLLVLTTALALIMFHWYVAAPIAVGTFLLMEAAGFLLPSRSDLYYVHAVHKSFRQSLAIAERFKNNLAASDYRERVSDIEMAYAQEIG
jgi:hypothetical protein